MTQIAFAKQVIQEFSKDKVGQLSAAFAYGALFSIGPLLLVIISVAGFVLGERAVQGRLFAEISTVVGTDTAKTIQAAVVHIRQSGQGPVALILGIVGLLLGAAGITAQLQNSFNTILGVVPDPKAGLKRTIYMRAKNILLVLIGGVFVAASVAASALIIGLGNSLRQNYDLSVAWLEILNNIVTFIIITIILFCVYRVLPDIVIPRKVALVTAAGVAVLFVIGKIVLGFVIGRNGTATAYGAAASLVALLLWAYYSGQILFIGAEGVKVHAYNKSLSFVPKKFNLKRETLHLDSNKTRGRIAEAWLRGFRKHAPK